MNHAKARHMASSQRMPPMCSIPSDIFSTLRLIGHKDDTFSLCVLLLDQTAKEKARIAYCALENRVVLVYCFIFFRKSKVASSLHGASGTISNNAKPSFYAGTCLAGTTSIIDNW